jgi:hypothetical protein
MGTTGVTSCVPDLARAAIDAAGNGAHLARQCGVTRYAVHLWRKTGIPAKHVGRISALTGIPPHRIRPDLFPPPTDAPAREVER